MPTYSKHIFSGSTDGLGILVAQTATAGDTVHTAHATDQDEIWIYAVNASAAAVKLTIEWGEAAVKGNISQDIPAESGLIPIIPGLILTNSLVVKAFAATTNVITLHGYVHRITA